VLNHLNGARNYSEQAAFDMRTGAAAGGVTRRIDAVWQQAQKIAADGRLTAKAKADDISSLAQSALSDIEAFSTPVLDELEAEIERLEQAGVASVTPNVEEIAQLQYTRDALQSSWRDLKSVYAALGDWKSALDSGDRIRARVYRDFLVPVWQEKQAEYLRSQFPSTRASHVALTPDMQELVTRTDELLVTKEQLKARVALGEMKERYIALSGARSAAAARLKGATYDPRRRAIVSGIEAGLSRTHY